MWRETHKTRGHGTRTLTVRTGAFRGPGKTHTNRSVQQIAFAKDTQNTRSGHQNANGAHGSLSGSWEKYTQMKHCLIDDVARDTQNTRSGHQDANRAHGSLSGSWENAHNSNTPLSPMCKIPTNTMVRIIPDQNIISDRPPAEANPREGCRFRALMRPKKLSIYEKPVNYPGLYSASVKIIVKIAVFRASLVTNSHKTHGGR